MSVGPLLFALVMMLIVALLLSIIFRRRILKWLGVGLTLPELEVRDRQREQRCLNCGYDLTQIDSIRCPECGEVRPCAAS